MRRLKAAFPDHPLRLDPNGGWTVETAIAAARRLSGILEYLEDPVLGFAEMRKHDPAWEGKLPRF